MTAVETMLANKQSITLPFYPVKRKLQIFQGAFCPFHNGRDAPFYIAKFIAKSKN